VEVQLDKALAPCASASKLVVVGVTVTDPQHDWFEMTSRPEFSSSGRDGHSSLVVDLAGQSATTIAFNLQG